MKTYILGIISALIFIGCGGNSSVSNSGTTSVAQLGVLANATVKIYVVQADGSKILLYTEITSDGTSFDDVGNFQDHFSELEDDKFYVYEVSGGEDRDANDDGILDSAPTINNGKIRLASKGSWLKEATDTVRVTAVSEIQYIHVHTTLFNDYVNIETRLQESVRGIVSQDINGDGVIDAKDISAYDPVNSKEKLNSRYKDSLASIISKIHSNDKSLVGDVFNPYIGLFDITRSIRITLSSDGTKAYVGSSAYGLKIIDIIDPASPTLLGTYDTDEAYNIILSSDGTKAYVAYGNSELQIIDITDATSPTLLGTYDIGDDANGITLSSDGTRAYITTDILGLVIIDISNPTSPTLLGASETAIYIFGVILSNDGTKAYVAGYLGLQIIDVSLYND